jgi:hypothetical protein
MNCLRIILAAISIAGCATTSYMSTGFASKGTLESDTIKTLQRTSDMQHSAPCSISAKSHVISEKRDTGNWYERWIVDRCGTIESYRVLYRPRPDGVVEVYALKE